MEGDVGHLSELMSAGKPASRRLSTSESTPRKWVGTPCKAVHFSATTASTMAGGSKVSEGYTIHEPCDQAARFPRTRRIRGLQ